MMLDVLKLLLLLKHIFIVFYKIEDLMTIKIG